MGSGDSGSRASLDFRGSRRLTGVEEWCWYLVAAVSYILAGMWHKWLLNWIIGPVWLVAIVCIGPPLLDRLRGRRNPTSTPRSGTEHGDAG